MLPRKEAIIFIPGSFGFVEEKEYYLNAFLIRGLTQNVTDYEIQLTGEAIIEGAKGQQLQVKIPSGEVKLFDLFEASWVDAVKKLSAENLKTKTIRGIDLLVYWIFSGTWKAFRECPTMVFASMLILILVGLWYYGTIALTLTAIGKDASFLGSALPPNLAAELGKLGATMGGWSLWLTVSAVLAFLPVDHIVDQMDFSKRFLQNDIDRTTGEALRIKIRKRIKQIVTQVVKQEDYEQVTIVAHSYGTLFGTEFLAESNLPTTKPIRYITIGGPLKLLSLKSKYIHTIIQEALQNSAVKTWTDYYSDRDWLCTATPIRGEKPPSFKHQNVLKDVPLRDVLSGQSHNAYFVEPIVIDDLLSQRS